MISKDIIHIYLEFYNEYKKDTNRKPTVSEEKAINQLKEATKNDKNLEQMVMKLQEEFDFNRQMDIIEEYFSQEKSDEKEEEVIAKTFGIDISNIKHQFLQNGKELFVFYSKGRNVVLENNKKGTSLVTQLKEMQLEHEEYQTENNSLNTEEMLNKKRMEENVQLSFLPVNQIENDKSILDKLDEKQLVQLSILLKNAVILHLKAINLENMLAIDIYQNIYEVYYSMEKNGYRIQKPNEASYHQETIEISSENTQNEDAEVEEIYENDYEDIPSILMHDAELTVSVEEAMQNIRMYYEYPEMIDTLPEEKKAFYVKYTELYRKYMEREEKRKNKQKKLIRKARNYRNAGYIDAFILALITGFGSGILFTFAYFLFR